jgi:hypothetical protein
MPRLAVDAAERLDEKSAYHTVAAIPLERQGSALVGLKDTGLDISLPDGLALHYDREGRLTRAATPNLQWRRGLSHRTIRLRKRSGLEGGGLETRLLTPDLSDRIANETSGRAREVLAEWQLLSRPLVKYEGDSAQAMELLDRSLSRAAAFDAQAARIDHERFTAVYGEIPILPPDQYRALVLLATGGCAYNRCTFCGFYRDSAFRRLAADEFRTHAREAIAYHGRDAAARRGVFLGQANALTGPRSWREEILRVANDEWNSLGSGNDLAKGRGVRGAGISSFIDAFTGRSMDADEFRELRSLNLGRLYLGVETGDSRLLEWLRKPATIAGMIETVHAAKQGGVSVGIILLVGAGGEAYFESHVRETTELLRAMRLGKDDYVYLSPMTEAAGAEYAALAAEAGIEPLSAVRMAEQTSRLKAVFLDVPRDRRPYVAHYEVAQFVY